MLLSSSRCWRGSSTCLSAKKILGFVQYCSWWEIHWLTERSQTTGDWYEGVQIMRVKCVRGKWFSTQNEKWRISSNLQLSSTDKNHAMQNSLKSLLGISISHDLGKLRWLLTTRETEATAIVASVAILFVQIHLQLLLLYASLVVVVILEIPDRRPAILTQVFLIFRVKKLQWFRRVAADAVVIDAKVGHAPLS